MGLFGTRPLYGTPGFNPEAPYPGAQQKSPFSMDGLQFNDAPVKKKRGLFGTGISGGDILGTLGDALLLNRGMDPVIGQRQFQHKLMEQQRTYAEQQAEMQRQQGLDDFRAKRDYEVSHPMPTQEERYMQAAGMSPEEQKAAYGQHVKQWAEGPPIVQTMQDGSFRGFPRSSVVMDGGNRPAPNEAVSELRDAVAKGDHGAIAEYDQIFGQGAAQRALGGPASAPGNFPH